MLRCVGTIGGALLGVWLVGTYTSSPVVFLLLIFIVLGIAIYKFGQYPSSQAPYAYYLVGLTTLSVATYGIQDPSDVWKIGLNRALEILVGSFCSLAVTSIIWPRYAREEFFELSSKALQTAAEVVSLETDSYIQLRDRAGQLEELQKRFEQQVCDASQSAPGRGAGKHSLLWTPRQLQRIRGCADKPFSSRPEP